MMIGKHTIRDGHPAGSMSLRHIIMKSSNIGAAKLGGMLGREQLASYLHRFGLGKRSGIEFPGETQGRIRNPNSWSEVGLAHGFFWARHCGERAPARCCASCSGRGWDVSVPKFGTAGGPGRSRVGFRALK